MKTLLVPLVIVFCGQVAAAATIHTGSYLFPQDTTNNIISIYVTEDTPNEQVQGLNFVIGIGDQVSAGQPLITAVDLENGTIFDGNHNPQQFPTFSPPGYIVIGSITTQAGSVRADGLLATVTVSMVGVPPGSYPIWLSKNFGFPQNQTNFAPTAANFDLGFIGYVPEPTSALLALMGFAPAALCVRRARRRPPA